MGDVKDERGRRGVAGGADGAEVLGGSSPSPHPVAPTHQARQVPYASPQAQPRQAPPGARRAARGRPFPTSSKRQYRQVLARAAAGCPRPARAAAALRSSAIGPVAIGTAALAPKARARGPQPLGAQLSQGRKISKRNYGVCSKGLGASLRHNAKLGTLAH